MVDVSTWLRARACVCVCACGLSRRRWSVRRAPHISFTLRRPTPFEASVLRHPFHRAFDAAAGAGRGRATGLTGPRDLYQ